MQSLNDYDSSGASFLPHPAGSTNTDQYMDSQIFHESQQQTIKQVLQQTGMICSQT